MSTLRRPNKVLGLSDKYRLEELKRQVQPLTDEHLDPPTEPTLLDAAGDLVMSTLRRPNKVLGLSDKYRQAELKRQAQRLADEHLGPPTEPTQPNEAQDY